MSKLKRQIIGIAKETVNLCDTVINIRYLIKKNQ